MGDELGGEPRVAGTDVEPGGHVEESTLGEESLEELGAHGLPGMTGRRVGRSLPQVHRASMPQRRDGAEVLRPRPATSGAAGDARLCDATEPGVHPGSATDPTADWLDAVRGLGPVADGYDDIDTRLGFAVVRGLLIDVLATGDLDAATAALERYLVPRAPS